MKDDSSEAKDKDRLAEDLTRSKRQDSNPDEIREEGVAEVIGKLTVDALNKNKKALLISGDTIECIMTSKKFQLESHLVSIYHVSSAIIAYDLRPKHKAFLINLMRQCNETVLAIGDGFNDIGMLCRANIGI